MTYDPTEYSRTQKAISDILHTTAPKIAAEFSKMDGVTWIVIPYVDDCGPSFRTKLVRECDGLAVLLCIDTHTKRVSCAPSVPMMPGLHGNGYSSLRDFLPYPNHGTEACEAGANADRYTSKPEAVAKDFHKRTVTPYAVYYVQILNKIEERKAGWQMTRDVADMLAKEHGGKISPNTRGESIGVYFGGSLPGLEVRYGGSVSTMHTLTMTADQTARVLAALATVPGVRDGEG